MRIAVLNRDGHCSEVCGPDRYAFGDPERMLSQAHAYRPCDDTKIVRVPNTLVTPERDQREP